MIQFGTGGWRAFIGEEFTKDNVCLVAQAVANIINDEQVADRASSLVMTAVFFPIKLDVGLLKS